MEIYIINKSKYKIIFIYNESILNISINYINLEGGNKIMFEPIQLKIKDIITKYISNFIDLIDKIKSNKIKIEIVEKFNSKENSTSLKSLYLHMKIDELTIIISQKINILNVEYFFVFGAKYQRMNNKPFKTFIDKDYFNSKDILELIDNEKILNIYNIDNFRYLNEEKGVFQEIKENNPIPIKEKLILEFHVYGIKNPFLTNLKWIKNILVKKLLI